MSAVYGVGGESDATDIALFFCYGHHRKAALATRAQCKHCIPLVGPSSLPQCVASGWLKYSFLLLAHVAQVFIPISGSNIGSHLAQIFVDIHRHEPLRCYEENDTTGGDDEAILSRCPGSTCAKEMLQHG